MDKFIRFRTELEKGDEVFDEECRNFLSEIRKAYQGFDEEKARMNFEHLMKINHLRKVIRDLKVSLVKEKTENPIYTVSSWFLYDSYKYLTKEPEEAIHYVTGIKIDNIFTLDRMVTFGMDKQSLGFVRGDFSSSHKALIQMDEYGHRLHAWFHSHPGTGIGASYPSGVDKDHQERLERGGYPAIGAIFTRDGFVRFFSLNGCFEVIVYGKEIDKVEERCFRLIEVS